MEQNTCQDCVHFKQHYHLTERYGFWVDCGHCVFPGIKHRKASAKACERFSEREKPDQPDREKTLRYLTTDILKWIMELELPPVIEEKKK